MKGPRAYRISANMNTPTEPLSLPPEGMMLPVRSFGQAMDWSLVLVSQGIENSIEQSEAGWHLWVATADAPFARETLRLYEAENRARRWRRDVFHSGVWFDGASVGWAVTVIFFYWLNAQGGGLRSAGLMDAQAVWGGEWWRLLTAIWLHGDLGHLAMNLAIGVPLVGLAMGSCGSGTGFLAALLAGAMGNIATLVFSIGPHRSLGASGLIMGALGLLTAQGLAVRYPTPVARRIAVGGLVGGIMLFVLLGLSPGTDVVAHAGGFVGGLFLGALLARRHTLARQTHVNVAAGLLAVALILGPWWLALR